MLAYHNDPAIKAAAVATITAHADADRLITGVYWEEGKGCAVGCMIQSGNHAEYETRFGIPQALAHLEDRIFENLPNEHAMRWPVRFMAAAPVGADLSRVQWQFLAFVVGEALDDADSVREACLPALGIVERLAQGEMVSAAARSARSAALAARSAESAALAARSAESAARSARSARSAALAARSAAWIRYADKLLELMAAASVPAPAS